MTLSDIPKWWPVIVGTLVLVGTSFVVVYRLEANEKVDEKQEKQLTDVEKYIANQDGYTRAITDLQKQMIQQQPIRECFDHKDRLIPCPK